MSDYKHIFFDLDHTLWDFEANSRETLTELYYDYKLDEKGFTGHEDFLTKYKEINDACWAKYRTGEMTKEELRLTRYRLAFAHFGYEDHDVANKFGEQYINICPHKTNLFPGALDVLDELTHTHELHIITNGFAEVQDVKLGKSGLQPYFKHIITSEQVGVLKPDVRIFQHAFNIAEALPEESLMVGDHLQVDVLGARKAGMDGVWFNPHGAIEDGVPTYEIKELKGLLDIV